MARNIKKAKGAYSAESIKKAVDRLNEKLTYYKSLNNADMIKLCISAGNRKIGRVYNVSLAPIICCKNCSACKHYCYDIKAVLQYANVADARARNTAIVQLDREGFFARIDEFISSKKRCQHKYFRWHVSGEILDIDYFDHMVRIARRHPDWIFWTYTKMYSVVNEWIAINGRDALPANFTVMFSEWAGVPMYNPYGMPEFRVRMNPDDAAPAAYKCPGNCDVCKAAHRGCVCGETVFADLH